MSREARLDEVRVEVSNRRKENQSRTNDFVYVNDAFVGSVNSVNNTGNRTPAPITGVYREQYCVCSRWPYTQRVLAIAVGVLLGALIGLAISMILKGDDDNVLGPIFTRNSVSN